MLAENRAFEVVGARRTLAEKRQTMATLPKMDIAFAGIKLCNGEPVVPGLAQLLAERKFPSCSPPAMARRPATALAPGIPCFGKAVQYAGADGDLAKLLPMRPVERLMGHHRSANGTTTTTSLFSPAAARWAGTSEDDWRRRPIGIADNWPAALRTGVSIILGIQSGRCLSLCGPASIPFCTMMLTPNKWVTRHFPLALGLPFLSVWDEISRGSSADYFERTYAGKSVHMNTFHADDETGGLFEETHFSFSDTPLRNEPARSAAYSVPAPKSLAGFFPSARLAEGAISNVICLSGAPGFMAIIQLGPEHYLRGLFNEAFRTLVEVNVKFVGATVA